MNSVVGIGGGQVAVLVGEEGVGVHKHAVLLGGDFFQLVVESDNPVNAERATRIALCLRYRKNRLYIDCRAGLELFHIEYHCSILSIELRRLVAQLVYSELNQNLFVAIFRECVHERNVFALVREAFVI